MTWGICFFSLQLQILEMSHSVSLSSLGKLVIKFKDEDIKKKIISILSYAEGS